MVAIFTLIISVLASTAFAHQKSHCLSDTEAIAIATRWLNFWGDGSPTSLADLASAVTSDVISVDYTYGDPIVGVDNLYQATIAADPFLTDVKQTPLTVFHSCSEIAARWLETAVATGVNGTGVAGTPITVHGTELISVDLKTRLIYNTSSSADWITVASQLGEALPNF